MQWSSWPYLICKITQSYETSSNSWAFLPSCLILWHDTEIFYSNNGLRVLAICSSILGWGKIRWNLNVYFFCYAELNICLYICWQSVPLKWIICSHSLSVFLLGFCLISHCSRRFLGVSNEPCLLVSVSLFPSPLKLGVLRWPASADRVRQK